LAKQGIGTVVSRRTKTKGIEYKKTWIYVPAEVSGDEEFPFEAGEPCQIEIATGDEMRHLIIRPTKADVQIDKGALGPSLFTAQALGLRCNGSFSQR
jgi:hypothetical protein